MAEDPRTRLQRVDRLFETYIQRVRDEQARTKYGVNDPRLAMAENEYSELKKIRGQLSTVKTELQENNMQLNPGLVRRIALICDRIEARLGLLRADPPPIPAAATGPPRGPSGSPIADPGGGPSGGPTMIELDNPESSPPISEAARRAAESVTAPPVCSICLENLNEGGPVHTGPCGHSLHRSCYQRLPSPWANGPKVGQKVCPECRYNSYVPGPLVEPLRSQRGFGKYSTGGSVFQPGDSELMRIMKIIKIVEDIANEKEEGLYTEDDIIMIARAIFDYYKKRPFTSITRETIVNDVNKLLPKVLSEKL